MTRKRFVKLLMSSGMSRNRANVCARRAIEAYGSYDKASAQTIQRTLTACVEGVERFKEMLLRIADVIVDVIRQDEELAGKCLTGLANRWGVEEGQQK
nr:MAG TPA: hypothetical protein [Caudoviricetes sp.]